METFYVISLNAESRLSETWRKVKLLGPLEAESRELHESNVRFFFRDLRFAEGEIPMPVAYWFYFVYMYVRYVWVCIFLQNQDHYVYPLHAMIG